MSPVTAFEGQTHPMVLVAELIGYSGPPGPAAGISIAVCAFTLFAVAGAVAGYMEWRDKRHS